MDARAYSAREAEASFDEFYAAQEDIQCRLAHLNALNERFDTLIAQGHAPEQWSADGIDPADYNQGGEWFLEFIPSHDLSYIA